MLRGSLMGRGIWDFSRPYSLKVHDYEVFMPG